MAIYHLYIDLIPEDYQDNGEDLPMLVFLPEGTSSLGQELHPEISEFVEVKAWLLEMLAETGESASSLDIARRIVIAHANNIRQLLGTLAAIKCICIRIYFVLFSFENVEENDQDHPPQDPLPDPSPSPPSSPYDPQDDPDLQTLRDLLSRTIQTIPAP